MSDDRPLRQEDYQAMAEQLRQDQLEIEALRAKISDACQPEAAMAAPARFRNIRENLVPIGIFALLVAALVGMAVDCYTKRGPVQSCYFVAHLDHRPMAWDPYYLWERKTTQHRSWVESVGNSNLQFDTAEKANEALRSYKVPICPTQ